ncbi:MAG TPA: hypothetical protein VMM60_18185 [Ilumatobacter sp.]|nr:hypothetical protein [Ilumatobacter sp.]
MLATTGAVLSPEWALQVPNDYRDVLRHAVPEAVAAAGVDASSGLVVGQTLRTRPEHVYRALLEAAAFGSRMIVETFAAAIHAAVAAGVYPDGTASRDTPDPGHAHSSQR